MLYRAFHMQVCLLQGPPCVSQFFNFTLSSFHIISNLSLLFSSQRFIVLKKQKYHSLFVNMVAPTLTPYLQYAHW